MTDLPQYDIGERQARLEAFAACRDRDLTGLRNEVALLRVLLEKAAGTDSTRLCIDIISQLQKCSTAIDTQRIKARELLHKSDVLRLMQELSAIIHDELMCLPQGTRVELVDRIVERIRTQSKQALLEVDPQ